jgi:hypothetical protein
MSIDDNQVESEVTETVINIEISDLSILASLLIEIIKKDMELSE